MSSDHSVYVQNLFKLRATHSEQNKELYSTYSANSIYSNDPAV